MKNLFKIIALLCITVTFSGCDSDQEDLKTYTGAEVLALGKPSQAIGACEPSSTVEVQSSAVSSSDRTYTLMVNSALTTADPSEYTLDTTVTIPAGEYLGSGNVTVDFSAIPEGAARTLVVDLVLPDGISATRESTTISYESVCLLNEVTLDMIFDSFPEEAAFILFDGVGNIVDASFTASGAIGFGVFAGESRISRALCLASGDYSVTFFDSYGDGNSEGTGFYGLSVVSCEGSTELFTPLSSSSFGAAGSTLGTDPVTIAFTID